ncbi:putative uncharacterized domain protein (plasmid) [Borreliella bissettiae DN127]|uniref:Uncharacterized domain protein n=1 Tax=Borrelia bissettiae (strain DSM 17990 / CIP 109136 / DN127) TaxID=521010 RepID=G0AMZ9_BORBD|nr:putative uncharacterized domain protein [Borreliella bissettiae DN127]
MNENFDRKHFYIHNNEIYKKITASYFSNSLLFCVYKIYLYLKLFITKNHSSAMYPLISSNLDSSLRYSLTSSNFLF